MWPSLLLELLGLPFIELFNYFRYGQIWHAIEKKASSASIDGETLEDELYIKIEKVNLPQNSCFF